MDTNSSAPFRVVVKLDSVSGGAIVELRKQGAISFVLDQ
jgi:hypothetical protein